MLCPVCQERLLISDRNGVEIDYCGKCRGVWLDRGELQKLIDMSQAQGTPQVQGYPQSQYRRYEDDREYDRRGDGYNGYGKPKKRESWFGELFDFD